MVNFQLQIKEQLMKVTSGPNTVVPSEAMRKVQRERQAAKNGMGDIEHYANPNIVE